MSPLIQKVYTGALGEIRYSALGRTELDFPSTKALSLKYVLAGEENYIVNGEEYKLAPQQLLLFTEGYSYTAFTYSYRDTSNQGFCIDLDQGFMNDARFDLFGEADAFILPEEMTVIKIHQASPTALYTLQKTYTMMGNIDELLLEEILNQLMQEYLLLEKRYTDSFLALPTLKTSIKTELCRKLLLAQSFIHDHKSQSLSLASIAKAVGLSKFYFQRLFTQFFGLSPSAYLEQIRMEAALQLIQKNQSSISDIAFQLGYSELSYFSRRFKQYFGKSPRQMSKGK